MLAFAVYGSVGDVLCDVVGVSLVVVGVEAVVGGCRWAADIGAPFGGGAASVAVDARLEDGGVVNEPVDGGDGDGLVGEDAIPGAEGDVGGDGELRFPYRRAMSSKVTEVSDWSFWA